MQMQPAETALPTKQNTAEFVHGVAEMEIRAFTLRETAKKIRNEAKEKESFANCRLSVASDNKEKQKNLCQTSSCGNFLKDSGGRTFIRALVSGFFITIFVVWISLIVAYYVLGLVEDTNAALLDFVLRYGSVIFLLTNVILWYIDYLSYQKKKKVKAEEATAALEQANKSYTDVLLVHQETTKLCETLNNKAVELDNSAAYIEGRLQQCYDLNIIPPSYRQLVYAVLLDDIFMNDKADTMREAILICDTELRHAELITKLDDIYHSLQTLAEHSRVMGLLLQNIQSNVHQISDHIAQMSDDQQRIAYAAEAVQHTAENADIYMYQRRTGII